MSASLKLEGLADLEAKLAQLGAVGGQKALASSGRKSFAPVLEDAKATVPVSDEPGSHLRDALDIVVQKKGLPGTVVARVGLRIKKMPAKVRRLQKALKKLPLTKGQRAAVMADPRRYWHLVEFGTSRSRAKPFIRPAFDRNTSRLLGALTVDLKRKVDRAVKKGLIGSEDA